MLPPAANTHFPIHPKVFCCLAVRECGGFLVIRRFIRELKKPPLNPGARSFIRSKGRSIQ